MQQISIKIIHRQPTLPYCYWNDSNYVCNQARGTNFAQFNFQIHGCAALGEKCPFVSLNHESSLVWHQGWRQLSQHKRNAVN